MRVLTLFLLTAAGLCSGAGLWAENLPEWLLPLREAVYEQRLGIDEITALYHGAQEAAAQHSTGVALDLALSRCEYLMGRALLDGKRSEEARAHFIEGMRLSERVVDAAPNAEAWVMLAENLSQACSIGPWTYTVANGLNVEKFAKNALSFDKRNAAAQFLIAARWVFAPAPFHNYKKGIEMMNAIFTDGDMGKDDQFNVCSAIGYAYIQQKKYAEARPWLLRSLEVYPTNNFAQSLFEMH